MATLLNGEALEARARELGVDISGEPRSRSVSGSAQRASEYELQRRVLEAERAQREKHLWLFALLAAIASVVSAITAVIAVASR